MSASCHLELGQNSRWSVVTPTAVNHQLPFYMTEVGYFSAGPNFWVQRPGGEGCHLLYTVSGRGTLQVLEREETMDGGYGLLVDGRVCHRCRTVSEEPWVHYWVHFSGRAMEGPSAMLQQTGSQGAYITDPQLFLRSFESLLDCTGVHDIQRSVAASMELTLLLNGLVQSRYHQRNNKKFGLHQQEIQQVISYIEQHYARQISLDHLISVVHLSKYYFLKLFKQYTGLSPYEYLIHYRINEAKKLLSTTDKPVGSIAAEVGFLDESNFIKQFKKITGSKPLEYRRQSWQLPTERQ